VQRAVAATTATTTTSRFCTRLEVVETDEGILFKPKKSFWDMAGAYSHIATPEEMKKQLDKLREEDG
jgi:hypothetical protein